jgi:hypothetical protein
MEAAWIQGSILTLTQCIAPGEIIIEAATESDSPIIWRRQN